MIFLNSEKKKQRKHIEHALFQVKYARRMKEDLLKPELLERLRNVQADLKGHLKAKRYEEGIALSDNAVALACDVHPAPRKAYALRENVEVFVVVIAVALGFRTYFFQPYQIPTGSMQPTLYGITSVAGYEPDWTDKVPVRWGKFLLTGSRYKEIRAKANGIMPQRGTTADTFLQIRVGGRRHKIHKDMLFEDSYGGDNLSEGVLYPRVPRPGTAVKKGDVIARGMLKQGDHIIVNRLITNFARPERGDIVVFSTRNLPFVRANSAYIKRLTGMPGERMSICRNRLYADGVLVDEPDVFKRQYEHEHYSGYSQVDRNWFLYQEQEIGKKVRPLFTDCAASLQLGENEFLMMGDNTHSSLDGRYFGGVPGENIIGIGFMVPWPFFNRGIHNDRAGLVK
ncbi:MAG: signal peptidase I [Kiritimatiellia bacterium]